MPEQPENASTPFSPDLEVSRKTRGPILTTLEEFYTIGPGPSSSHTIGPMRATYDFVTRARALPAETLRRATALRVHLFGSLSATGIGHGTDRAALAGLLGRSPADCEPEFLDAVAAGGTSPRSCDLGVTTVEVSLADIVRDAATGSFPHPNTMQVRLLAGSDILFQREYYSVGGGFIEWEGYVPPEKSPPPYPYATMAELRRYVLEQDVPLSRVLLENEMALSGRSEQDVWGFLDTVIDVMLRAVDNGFGVKGGVLPGPIGLHSKAWTVLTHAQDDVFEADRAISMIAAAAIAAAEENARGHIIVTAPTAGSAGVLPALVSGFHSYRGVSDQVLREGLLVAAMVGYLCKHNATLSGAEGGCQAEIGVAAAMGAALAAHCAGSSIRVIENAAESALEHHLGLTCDPVAGYVQVPCIERCAFGAVKAWTAYCIASNEEEVKPRVDLDTCIAAMAMTAHDMLSKYKETSEAGLAALVLC